MEFHVTITLDGTTGDPAVGEALLERFLAAAPGSDPVVDQHLPTGTTTVELTVEAEDATGAGQATVAILHAAANVLARATARPTAIHVDAVGDPRLRAA